MKSEAKEIVKYSLSHIFQNLGVSQVVLPETISIGDDLKPRSELPLLMAAVYETA